MQMLILSIFLYACESWTLTELERRYQALEMRCYRRLLNISYKDHVTNEAVRNRIQNATGVHDDLLTMVKTWKQMVWPHLKILWHGEDNSAGDSERSKKERKTTSRNGQEYSFEIAWGQQRQGKVEMYCCNVICGAPITVKVKGLRDEINLTIHPVWSGSIQWFKRQGADKLF